LDVIVAKKKAPLSRTERLRRLLEISRILSSTLELPLLLQAIVELATELTNSEAASILLYERDSGQLRFAVTPLHQGDSLDQLNVPLDESAAGWAFTNRRPLVIQDAADDPRVFRKVDQTIDFDTRSLLAVPLMIKKEPIGVVEAVNKLEQGHYTEDDLEFLETLSAQAAIAIENARLLRELQTANTELERLDRMKSDFVAITSHELRTPLGLILGHATYLTEIVPQKYKEQVEAITRSAMRLKTIIEDLSSIAHKEQGEARIRRTFFSMSDLAQEVLERFSTLASEKSINLLPELPRKGSLKVEADREKLKVALSHLVRNALTFTDPNGTVSIQAEKQNGFVKVTVSDSGIGIPEDDAARVFERFFQVEAHLTRKHGGMGLGLSIAKAMIELHGGQIWCESEEGVGSKFAFIIPERARQAEAAARVFKTS
jgi:signal transduction histidine kinase